MVSKHQLYRHQLHGTICLHIFVVVPLCRSFYLNSSLTFSSPLSLLSNIIPYNPYTLFRFKSFFPFYFYFYLVCSFLTLFDVIRFGALANLRIWFDLIWRKMLNCLLLMPCFRWQRGKGFRTWCTRGSGVGRTSTRTSWNTVKSVSLRLTWNATVSASTRSTTSALFPQALVCDTPLLPFSDNVIHILWFVK